MIRAALRSQVSLGRFATVGFVAGVAAICALTAWARADGLNPRALWYDDAWVALVKRVAWGDGVVAAGRSSPVGFTLLIKLLLDTFDDIELAAQALPFAASLAVIPAFAWLVHDIFRSRALALLGAALIAVTPVLTVYATRAKQYTLECLLVIVLLGVFFRVLTARERPLRQLLILCAMAVGFAPFGHTPLFVAFVLMHVATAWLWYAHSARVKRAASAGVCLGFDAVFAVYYLLVLRGQKNTSLDRFWTERNAFAPLGGSSDDWIAFLRDVVWGQFIARAFPPGGQAVVWLCAALLGLGAIAMWRPLSRRVLGGALLLLYVQALVLSALRLYPLGGGRVDIYMHPVHLLLVIAGVWFLLERVPQVVQSSLPVVTAVTLMGLLPGIGAPRQAYHRGTGSARLIARIDSDADPQHGVLVAPKAGNIFALYTSMDVMVRQRPAGTGVQVTMMTPNVLFVPMAEAEMEESVQRFLSQGFRRVYLFSVQKVPVYEQIVKLLRRARYRLADKDADDGALMLRFDAREPRERAPQIGVPATAPP